MVEKDNITVGQIRNLINKQLEEKIQKLNGLIRAGYYKRAESEKYLNEEIGETLTRLQNLDSMASNVIMRGE